MSNPERALAALNAATIDVDGHGVLPVTLRLACVLEAVGSPLATGEAAAGMAAWAETLYAMTRPAAESQRLLAKGRDAFRAAAMEWADGVQMRTALRLVAAARRQTAAATGVNPEPEDGGDAGEAPAATAG